VTGSLLDPDFVRRLDRLKVAAQRRFAGTSAGARRSTRRGASVEFKDHRPYGRGDDVRRIDWNAYARLGELVLRLYVAEEDLSIHLLLDRSRSLAFGDPPGIELAKRAAAALGYVGLSGSERVGVVPFAAGISASLAPGRGRRAVGPLLRFLEGIAADGETDLERTVDQFLARRPRPGVVVLISDLLDPAGFTRPIDRLLSERHEPVLLHVLDDGEPDADQGADLVLVDSERGAQVEVTLDVAARRAYAARVAAFAEEVAAHARRRGVTCVRIGGSLPFEEALLDLLGRR
jgi:uncharacterized protein (DUF58 family)